MTEIWYTSICETAVVYSFHLNISFMLKTEGIMIYNWNRCSELPPIITNVLLRAWIQAHQCNHCSVLPSLSHFYANKWLNYDVTVESHSCTATCISLLCWWQKELWHTSGTAVVYYYLCITYVLTWWLLYTTLQTYSLQGYKHLWQTECSYGDFHFFFK